MTDSFTDVTKNTAKTNAFALGVYEVVPHRCRNFKLCLGIVGIPIRLYGQGNRIRVLVDKSDKPCPVNAFALFDFQIRLDPQFGTLQLSVPFEEFRKFEGTLLWRLLNLCDAIGVPILCDVVQRGNRLT